MFIPLRTDRALRRRPIVVELLIVANMLVYLFGLVCHYFEIVDIGRLVNWTHFYAADFKFWQLITYQFIHDPGSIWHLAFNMLFLWVFGTAVEDRLGHASFLAFYLMGGCLAGLAHGGLEPHAPVIGASGAIAGITGGFLALFPRSRIKLLFFLMIISIPALWFIGFYFVIDVLRGLQHAASRSEGAGGVAYAAHIAGYIYGFCLAFTLLATGIVKREEVDIFFLFKQSRRRAALRAVTRTSKGGVWDSPNRSEPTPASRQPAARPPTEEELRVAELRSETNRLMGEHDLPAAARVYERLLQAEPEAVLIEQRQLDIANQLYAEARHPLASRAYELFLKRYPRSMHAAEVGLILGLLYARHLANPKRAIELIKSAQARLTDTAQKALADQLLSELST